jgi:CubicO group peptidase (beta-lactamase class C family)
MKISKLVTLSGAFSLVCAISIAAPEVEVSKARLANLHAAKITNLPPSLSETQVRAHVVQPSNIADIRIEEVDEAKEVQLRHVAMPKKLFKKSPHLDVGAFGTAMHAALKDNVVGYMLQLRQNGSLVQNLIWNWAKTPADSGQGWSETTRMHVASVSKFLTAVALVKALDAKTIGYDTKITGYLPEYWTKGANIGQISFRQLLTHKSGFSTGGSSSDYKFMKARVAAGVTTNGQYDYENMNFGLARILIPIINGELSKTTTFIADPNTNDQVWDAVTLYHFKNYMQERVFTPSGVASVSFAPPASGTGAFAYLFPNGGAKGWDSGDLASVAGGAGFRLSSKELLDVMGTVRRKNSVLASTKAQELLDSYFGIDQIVDSPAGKLYNKNGAWGTGDGKKEQCVAYFLPDGMELVVFVNSKIGGSDFSLRGLVKDTFLATLAE